jgi:hypothetical protein
MKMLMLLVAMLAMVMMLATPTVAQDDKAVKQADASLLGLGAGALLVGGGLLVRKVTR